MLTYNSGHLFGDIAWRWRHNGPDSVSNDQHHDCLLNRLFRRRSKKTSKLRVTGLCVGNSPGTGEFSAQMAIYAENVSISWRHHGFRTSKWLHNNQKLPTTETKFSSLSALKVVNLTTFSAVSDKNFIEMKTFPFQGRWDVLGFWCYVLILYKSHMNSKCLWIIVHFVLWIHKRAPFPFLNSGSIPHVSHQILIRQLQPAVCRFQTHSSMKTCLSDLFWQTIKIFL